MSKEWDYAKLTQNVAKAGGVNIWIEQIKKAAYEQGSSDTKNKLILPLLVTGAVIGAVGHYAYQKANENKAKNNTLTKEAEKAELFLKEEMAAEINKTNKIILEENDNEKF